MSKTELETITILPAEMMPEKFSLTDAKLSELRQECDPDKMPESSKKGDAGYKIIHERAMTLRNIRTNIGKIGKQLKQPARDYIASVGDTEKKLTADIEKIEKPWKDRKQFLDDEAKRVEAEKEQAERDRLKRVESIVDGMRDQLRGLIRLDSAGIDARIAAMQSIQIDESFGEQRAAAQKVFREVMDDLNDARAAARMREEAPPPSVKVELAGTVAGDFGESVINTIQSTVDKAISPPVVDSKPQQPDSQPGQADFVGDQHMTPFLIWWRDVGSSLPGSNKEVAQAAWHAATTPF